MINSVSLENADYEHYITSSFGTEYSARPLMEKIWDVFCAVIKTVLFYLSMLPRFFGFAAEERDVWKVENNKGLYVIIHGLNGSPKMTAMNYAKQIEKDHPGTYEIRAPHVYKKGNCSLKDAARPILKMIKSYIAENPGKPIHLIGTSNGARIAARVEVALRKKDVNIRVTAIAGVFFGSKTVEQLKKWGVAHFLLHKAIIKDFSIGSEKARRLIEKMREPVTTGSRSYEFYATPNDGSIPNTSSCFPKKILGATYHPPVKGESHVSLWNNIRRKVLQDSYKWMRRS